MRILSIRILALLFSSAALHAQVATGEIAGSVIDTSGAVVANAKVTLTNTDTGNSREVASDATGSYIFALVPPGAYTLSAEASGFRKLVQSGIRMQVDQHARVDLTMQLGQVSETINVEAAAPLLESQNSSLGSVINDKLVNELPLNGRNFVQLATLSPGVNGVGYSVGGTIMSGTRPDDRRPGSEIFANGNREGSNNFLFDGIDNNERLTLSIVLRPAVEGVREFKVQTNLYSAEFGRNSGAIVDVVTKSGTNKLHGSLFEDLRNSAMDSRGYYNTKGTFFPPFRFNQFGFSLGGPLTIPKVYSGKNRTFFFVDYEGYRRTALSSFLTTLPTMQMRTGDFSAENRVYDPLSNRTVNGAVVRDQFPNQIIPATRFDTPTARMVNAYPAPVNSGRVNNYLVNVGQVQNWDQGDVRVDHQFSPKDSFFARWSIQHTATTVPNWYPKTQIPGLPQAVSLGDESSFAGTSFAPTQHAATNWVHVFSPRLINEVRVGFNRFVLDYTGEGYEAGLALGDKLGIRNANVTPNESLLPIFSPASYGGIGHSRSLPIFRRENTFQYADNVTFISGHHTLKFGADFRRRQITEYQTNRGNGRLNFSQGFTALPGTGGTGNSIASMLLGYPTLFEHDYTLAWIGQRGIESGMFFADDFRVSKKLTLNLGLRWEYFSPFSEVANRWANFDLASATVLVAGRDGVDSRAGIKRDFKDWAPRLGIAYQVAARTVIRGGWGLFYNPSGNGGAAMRLQRHVPFGPIYSISPGDTVLGPRASDGFPALPAVNFDSTKNPTGGVIGIASDFRSAIAQQFNFTVEQEVAPLKALLKVAYAGNIGGRLSTTYDANQPVPGPGSTTNRRPFFNTRPALAGVTYAVADGHSNYQSLQVTVEKRMTHGLNMLLGYTWAHAIDDVATDFGGGAGTPQDPRCRFNCERGNSNFDMRHRATLSYLYRIPFNPKGPLGLLLGGWQTNGIVTIQSGLPFNLGLAVSTTNGTGSRPDRIADGTLSSSERTLQRWFNPAAFGTPAIYTYGNAARNPLFGPGRVNFDNSLFKDFAIKEDIKFQFRAESFNTFNHPQFGQPNGTIGSPSAGVIGSTVGNPRQIQLALRFQF